MRKAKSQPPRSASRPIALNDTRRKPLRRNPNRAWDYRPYVGSRLIASVQIFLCAMAVKNEDCFDKSADRTSMPSQGMCLWLTIC